MRQQKQQQNNGTFVCGIWIATSKTHHRINSALMGGYQTAAAKVAANENSTSKKLRYLA
jgi:hypothetical protein